MLYKKEALAIQKQQSGICYTKYAKTFAIQKTCTYYTKNMHLLYRNNNLVFAIQNVPRHLLYKNEGTFYTKKKHLLYRNNNLTFAIQNVQ